MLSHIQDMDIYLIDQLLKRRFEKNMKILDAGCGQGRNSEYFIKNHYDVYGVDLLEKNISHIRKLAYTQTDKNLDNHFSVSDLDNLPFENNFFDHIICNAVLHFARNHTHFQNMFDELWRVLNENGILFLRTAIINGIETLSRELGDGRYLLPDGTERYLTNFQFMDTKIKKSGGSFLEPMKSALVHNQRSMGTFVLKKD